MKFDRNVYLSLIVLAGVLGAGQVWADTGNCAYTPGGTGMGGTGAVAKGSGIGGTGITSGSGSGTLQYAGQVIMSHGHAEALSNGQSRLLAKGDAVCVGETIVTSSESELQISMGDKGLIEMRPQTRLKIEKFDYYGAAQDRSLIDLGRGTARFVTGQLGKLHPENDLIRTPNATIGVRGTDHLATVILPEDKASYPSGTYDMVNTGVTFIKTDAGVVDVHPDQVGFAVDIDEMPILLKDIPEFDIINPVHGDSLPEGGAEHPGDANEIGGGVEAATPRELELPSGDNIGIEVDHIEAPEAPEVIDVPETPSLPTLPEDSD